MKPLMPKASFYNMPKSIFKKRKYNHYKPAMLLFWGAISTAPLILISAAPVYAQTTPNQVNPNQNGANQTSAQFNNRAQQLIGLFDKQIAYDAYFSANFLQAVPTAQLDQIINSVSLQYGRPVKILSINANSRNAGIVKLQFEKALATIEMVVNPAAPYKVSGLLLQGFEVIGDDFSNIESEISNLPGIAGYAIHRLNDGAAPVLENQINADYSFAIGSTFKLYILAELAAQIENGQRSWSDVAPLTPKSATLGGTQNWPEGSLLTLQSLATLMISISDNNATDALIYLLGRNSIEARVAQIGHDNIDKITPFLSTAEAFAFKMKINDKLRKDFLKANEAQQQRILVRNTRNLSIANYNPAEFANGPLYINDIEWFASSSDIARLMDVLRQSRDPVIRNILSINSGIGIADAQRWNYLGYKGGSEPGVISLSYVVQSKSGQWYSVTGSWNNPDKVIEEASFVAIMTRLLNILSKQ